MDDSSWLQPYWYFTNAVKYEDLALDILHELNPKDRPTVQSETVLSTVTDALAFPHFQGLLSLYSIKLPTYLHSMQI